MHKRMYMYMYMLLIANWHLQSNKQAIYCSNFIGAISFTGPGGGGGGTVGNKALTTPFFTIWRCLQPLYSCSVPTRKSQLQPPCVSCSLCLLFLFAREYYSPSCMFLFFLSALSPLILELFFERAAYHSYYKGVERFTDPLFTQAKEKASKVLANFNLQ